MGSKNAAVGFAVLFAVGWGVAPAVASADPPAPPPGPKTVMDHDGTYAVGTDIAPGTYSSAGPVENGTCYWKRVGNTGPGAGPNGDPDAGPNRDHNDIIDNAMTKKPQVVTIEPSDKAFKTDGCQPWQQTDAAAPPPPPPDPNQLKNLLGTLNGNPGPAGPGQVPAP